mgnify:CR=1 FL=1
MIYSLKKEVVLLKYMCELIINKNRDEVAKEFINHEHMPLWQKSLIDVRLIKGAIKQPGSLVHLIYQVGQSEMVMREKVIINHSPYLFVIDYEVDGVWNRCINYFIENEDQTLWIMESEFKFDDGTKLPKSSFEEKTLLSMNTFKEYIERI